jgi:hypothetical protein
VPVKVLGVTPGDAAGRFDLVLSQGGLRGGSTTSTSSFSRATCCSLWAARLVLVSEPLSEELPLPWTLDPSPGATDAVRVRGTVELAFRPSYSLRRWTNSGSTRR